MNEVKIPKYTYSAKLVRVVDGDTLVLDIDLGFNVYVRETVRLYGVNTPETHGPKAKTEMAAGLAAKVYVEDWLAKGVNLVITSHDGKRVGQEKFGRWLVDVWADVASSQRCLNQDMLDAGHAKPLVY